MPKTYCFLYLRFGWQGPEAVFVKACGYVQAVSEARRKLKYIDDIVKCACFPARRAKIRHFIHVMTPNYKGWCN